MLHVLCFKKKNCNKQHIQCISILLSNTNLRPSQGFGGTGPFISGEQMSNNEGNKGNFGDQGIQEIKILILGNGGTKAIYFRGTREQVLPWEGPKHATLKAV